MQTLQVVDARPSEAQITAAWAVIELDPRRAHLFDCQPDGRGLSRCGTALSVAPLLLGVRGERPCPACVERIAEFVA